MDRITAFIGYSSAEKKVGGKLKQYLMHYCGYETFIAHDDIPGATIWEDEIIHAIEHSDFVIPLISEEFKKSDFTDQEIGAAVCLKKKIIPVKLGTINPYGFISKYQALQYKMYPQNFPYSDNMNELALIIAQIGLLYKPKSLCHQKALNSIVYAFCNSGSFQKTNATIQIICKCTDLSQNHLQLISHAIKNNSQIIDAFGLPELKKFLKKTYGLSLI